MASFQNMRTLNFLWGESRGSMCNGSLKWISGVSAMRLFTKDKINPDFKVWVCNSFLLYSSIRLHSKHSYECYSDQDLMANI